MKRISPIRTWFSILLITAMANCVIAHDGELELFRANVMDQEQVLVAEQALEQLRFDNLQQLFHREHASWLEQRQQQLKHAESLAHVRSFQQYAAKIESLIQQHPTADFGRHLNFGSIAFTDLQVASTPPSENVDTMKLTIGELREQYLDSQREQLRLKNAVASLQPTDSWRPEYVLRLDLLNKKTNWLASRVRLMEAMMKSSQAEEQTAAEVKLTPSELDTDLHIAVEQQCKAHEQLLQHIVGFEQQRLNALAKLNTSDAAADMQLVQSKLESLRNSKGNLQRIAQHFPKSTGAAYVKNEMNWTVATASQNMSRQIHDQFARCEAEYQRDVARLRKQMLTEVLGRLLQIKQPAISPNYYDSLSQSIEQARHNEIANYRWRIELMELDENLAIARLKTMDTASGRFVVSESKSDKQQANRFGLDQYKWLGLATPLLNQLVTAPASSYREFAAAKEVKVADLSLFSGQLFNLPQDRFRAKDLTYHPLELSPRHLSYRPRYRSPSTLSSSSLRSRSSFQSRSTAYSNRSRYETSRYDYGYYRNSSSHYHRNRGRQFARAYPFGVLDSSLRSFITPSQTPWLLPGSSTNLRTQQLRTNFGRDSFGRTGNQLLKTRQYTDIYRQ